MSVLLIRFTYLRPLKKCAVQLLDKPESSNATTISARRQAPSHTHCAYILSLFTMSADSLQMAQYVLHIPHGIILNSLWWDEDLNREEKEQLQSL